MIDIQTLAMGVIFAVFGGLTMYQWLSFPRIQKEKDLMLKKVLVILLGAIVLLGLIFFTHGKFSGMLDKWRTEAFLVLVLLFILFGNRHKTSEEQASDRRVCMLLVIGAIILFVLCSLIC